MPLYSKFGVNTFLHDADNNNDDDVAITEFFLQDRRANRKITVLHVPYIFVKHC